MPWPTVLRVSMILPMLDERLHLGDILVNQLIGGRCLPSANVFTQYWCKGEIVKAIDSELKSDESPDEQCHAQCHALHKTTSSG